MVFRHINNVGYLRDEAHCEIGEFRICKGLGRGVRICKATGEKVERVNTAGERESNRKKSRKSEIAGERELQEYCWRKRGRYIKKEEREPLDQKSFAAEAFLELTLILGGALVLEPQPWKSYENNRLVSETTAMNYRSILFRPANFEEILLDKIGFRKVEDITSHFSGSKAGFNRPILVFHK
ncbi:hypothetical protein SO802_019654 [Lithocarpus litseifolius]|uniref:RNA methyltransferase n=1 Tax=Lithocarpus litseifolius TaxID=425828 RepID=A0AAW2CPA0_9ROSI